MGCPVLALWFGVSLPCFLLLAQVSGMPPECSIMVTIELEREKCLKQSDSDNQTLGCRNLWDNITCWPATRLGETRVLSCPIYFTFFSQTHGNVSRDCTSEGWSEMYPAPYGVACGFDPNTTGSEEEAELCRIMTMSTQGGRRSVQDSPGKGQGNTNLRSLTLLITAGPNLEHAAAPRILIGGFLLILGGAVNLISPIQFTLFYGTVKTGYTIGYSLSLIVLTAAMIVLCIFRKLHCTRNFIHMHLFMSFIMRAIAVFIKDFILFENGESDHCSVSSFGCKAAMVFFQYCVMANFFWLLVEGLYLHTLLVISFFSEKKYFWWYILIGWGSPTVFISAWTITRINYEDLGCWDLIDSPHWWIIKTPILVSILINFILFICIIRILVQKLHSPDVGRNETSQYSRLAKSTLLLIPLFGIHYTIFAFYPDTAKKEVLEVKLVFELVLGSFQGFVVAVLYCFLNGEVQAELKRKWRRWHMERFLGSDMKYHHPSLGSSGTNFSTQISMLTKCSPKTRRCSSFQADLSLV